MTNTIIKIKKFLNDLLSTESLNQMMVFIKASENLIENPENIKIFQKADC